MKPVKNEARMSNDARLAILETTAVNINSTLLDIKQGMKDIRLEIKDIRHDMKQGFEKVDNKFDRIENRLWSNFLWLMGTIIGLAGLIAHTQHWI